LFENLLAWRNHLGLLFDDIGPDRRESRGKFPAQVEVINDAMKRSKTWEDVV
jgi:hypothetical protein